MTAICTNCPDSYQYECLDCGMDLAFDCECVRDDLVDEIDVYCHGCQGTYTIDVETIWGDDDYEDVEEELNFTEYTDTKSLRRVRNPQIRVPHTQCRHYDFKLELPDGTNVYASSMHERPEDEVGPDLGVYLDRNWTPTGLAYTIDWQDFGLPERWDAAAYTIIDAFKKARDGFWVEVGCIGGHGRTGTALACMAVLSGLEPVAAVKFIRSNYCAKAIESTEQEWFVQWFHTYIHGGKIEELEWWDRKTKSYLPGKTFKYNDPFDWENWSIQDSKRGYPKWQAQLKETVYYTRMEIADYEKAHGKPTPEQIKEAQEWKLHEDEEDAKLAASRAKAAATRTSTSVLSDIPGATRVDVDSEGWEPY